ncbi:DUF1576 domain-containing protein [Streptobacillus moniliformis]|uniref:DUF1576 domain-containing protein n=1 Tax=Streptobacillus moniliformis TaxID=34105 RepID=UPI0009BD0803|nr:DUF1576 domain-containing protein [Streptobacillus moniliformis]
MKEKTREYIYFFMIPLLILFYAFILNNPKEIFEGVNKILNTNDILISDYFYISNLGATFFNAGIICLFNAYLIYIYDLKLNGLLIVSVLITLSFGFMGKNIYNIIPFYIGSYIYIKFIGREFKTVIPITMMSTTLAPIVSSLGVLGIIMGIFIGFIMPIITKHTLLYHGGYNLYNTGFAGGLFGIILYSIILSFGIKFDVNRSYNNIFYTSPFIFFLLLFSLMVIIGYLNDKNIFENMKSIHRHTGRLVTDFVQEEGFYASFFNMGIMGLVCLIFPMYFKVFNGPVICAILTVVSFGGFGKHLKNILPVMIGVIIMYYLTRTRVDETILLMTVFFSTTLAPIAGKYGWHLGIIAGIFHFSVATQIGAVHGGMNLYNNGLAAGIVSSIYVPIIEEIKGVINIVRTRKNNS